ncbi:MAG: aspartate aminotransferase family protein [Candidatus Bathyarchaeia archaeon]
MPRKLTKSEKLYRRAEQIITGGVHSNYRYSTPHPRYYVRAKGPYVWDVDGNKYIDCICNMGACILGHAHPKVMDAVKRQLTSGLTNGLETELSVEVARLLNEMVPSAEVIKFSNTGTEAVMHAIQIARAYTRKDRIAKLEGGYDGWYDYVLMSTHPRLEEAGSANQPNTVPGTSGLAESARGTVILPFNNIKDTVRIIRENKDDLAAVVMEPVMFNVGCVTPDPQYLKAVREVTEDLGIILVFDEVITGFRMAPGGAQEYYGVIPDMSTFAKAIANGFPLAAVVGKREIMQTTDPKTGNVMFYGTYNAHQAALAAAYATLRELKTGRVQKHLHEASKWLVKEVEELSADLGVKAIMQSIAGKFQVYFTSNAPVDYRSAMLTDQKKYGAYHVAALECDVLMHSSPTGHQGLTSAHSKDTLLLISRAIERGLESAKALG